MSFVRYNTSNANLDCALFPNVLLTWYDLPGYLETSSLAFKTFYIPLFSSYVIGHCYIASFASYAPFPWALIGGWQGLILVPFNTSLMFSTHGFIYYLCINNSQVYNFGSVCSSKFQSRTSSSLFTISNWMSNRHLKLSTSKIELNPFKSVLSLSLAFKTNGFIFFSIAQAQKL